MKLLFLVSISLFFFFFKIDCAASLRDAYIKPQVAQVQAFHAALDSNSLAEVAALLDSGCSANMVLQPEDDILRTLMKNPCQSGVTVESKTFLIEQGVCSSWTPLLKAISLGHKELAALLLEKGALIDLAAPNGLTPLICAARKGDPGLVALCLSYKPSLEKMDYFSCNALAASLMGCRVPLGEDRFDSLDFHVTNGHHAVLKQLVSAGASMNDASYRGLPPLLLALKNGNEQGACLLRSLGAQEVTIGSPQAVSSVAKSYQERLLALKLRNEQDRKKESQVHQLLDESFAGARLFELQVLSLILTYCGFTTSQVVIHLMEERELF
jgi:hypothetical protein